MNKAQAINNELQSLIGYLTGLTDDEVIANRIKSDRLLQFNVRQIHYYAERIEYLTLVSETEVKQFMQQTDE